MRGNGYLVGLIVIPTLALLVLAWILFVSATYFGIKGIIPVWSAMLLNCLAAYLAYSVVHEASHYLVSSKVWLNDLLGHVAMLLLMPSIGFLLYRAVHFCHHKHTNQAEDTDPDLWLSRGSFPLMILKWAFMDIYYFNFYSRNLAFRTTKSTLLFVLAVFSTLGILVGLYLVDLIEVFLLYAALPTRLTNIVLSWTFAYLPHAPHKPSVENDPDVTTNIRLINKPWLNWILLGHCYHRMHHLDPSIPFFHYVDVWKERALK